MSKFDDAPMRAELAELRAALAALDVPAIDEQSLRARFRAAARPPPQPQTAPARRARGARYLAAAGVLLAVAAAALLASLPPSAEAPALARAPAAPSALASEPFQRLLGSPGFSPTASFSVVRVQIPLSSLAIVPGTEQGGTIEADLLVGEDGLAHGIRFTEGGASLGAARAQ